MYPAVVLIYLISVSVILIAYRILLAQFSLPYYEVAKASVLYNFILVFFGLNTLLINACYFQIVI
jgi:hypothetical protein